MAETQPANFGSSTDLELSLVTSGIGYVASSNTGFRSDQHRGWRSLRFLITAILFLAAGSKVVNAPMILAGDGLLASRPLLVAIIAFEAASAVYLWIGNPVRAWWLTIGTFSLFTVFAG